MTQLNERLDYSLKWLQIEHSPKGWSEKMQWIIKMAKGKTPKQRVLIPEALPAVCRESNKRSHGNTQTRPESRK